MGKAYFGPKKNTINIVNMEPKAPNQQPIGVQQEQLPEAKTEYIYIDRPTEVVVTKIVEKPIEIIKEVIKEVKVIEEKIVHITKEIPVEVIKIEEKIVEVEKFINKEIHKVPSWMWGLVGFETLLIAVLLLFK